MSSRKIGLLRLEWSGTRHAKCALTTSSFTRRTSPASPRRARSSKSRGGMSLTAAPLLVAAYALLWIAVVGYLWSIWRRMMTVERELSDLSKRTGES